MLLGYKSKQIIWTDVYVIFILFSEYNSDHILLNSQDYYRNPIRILERKHPEFSKIGILKVRCNLFNLLLYIVT